MSTGRVEKPETGSGPPRPRSFVERLRRFANIDAGEGPALLWGFIAAFCILGGWFVIRPVREQMGITGGVANLPWAFTGTFIATCTVVVLYAALVARCPPRVFLPVVFRILAASMIAFWAAFRWLPSEAAPTLARVFYVFASVHAFLAPCIMWSFLADVFAHAQAKRLFAYLAAGGTAGALAGSVATLTLATLLGTIQLLLVPALLLEGALLAFRRLARTAPRGATAARAPEPEAARPRIWDGLARVARSPYLLLIAGYVLCMSASSTFVYMLQARAVRDGIADPDERTAWFALINLGVQALTIVWQTLVATRVIVGLGVGCALAALPVLHLAGFATLALAQGLVLLAVFDVLRKSVEYGLAKPAREVLFTVVGRTEKYASKSVIDLVIYRGGDALHAWLFRALADLGLGVARLAAAIVPLGLAWLALAWALGRGQARRAAALDQASGRGSPDRHPLLAPADPVARVAPSRST